MNTIIIPLLTFAVAACITPGPNNIMLTASGANFGFKRTIPHILGICFGLEFLMLVVALGFNILFSLYPQLQVLLKVAGSVYLLYLAWKIATSKKPVGLEDKGRPFTFVQAAAFQLLNPKALMMAVTSMSTFTLAGDRYFVSAMVVMFVYSVICLPSISAWASFGTAIGRLLKSNRAFRIFNLSMGGLTAASVGLILM